MTKGYGLSKCLTELASVLADRERDQLARRRVCWVPMRVSSDSDYQTALRTEVVDAVRRLHELVLASGRSEEEWMAGRIQADLFSQAPEVGLDDWFGGLRWAPPD